jgi:hypothetical protein
MNLPEIHAPQPHNWHRHRDLATQLTRTWEPAVERMADVLLLQVPSLRTRPRGAGLDRWAEFTCGTEDGRPLDWHRIDLASEAWLQLLEKMGVESPVVRFELTRVVHWRVTMGLTGREPRT